MGGLHSGRKRRHTCIDECLVIDTAWLNKQKFLTRSVRFSMGWKHTTITGFSERTEQARQVSAVFLAEDHTLTLSYQIEQIREHGHKNKYTHAHMLNLESTPCNYGGARWWFTAPCCSARVRVLYINPRRGDIEHMTPQCRNCLELHYPSQMASYIERHKTYERHLLANYGLYWAKHRYDYELQEHYLGMTPELWAMRLKAVIDWNMHLLKEVIKCDLMIYRSDLRNLKSLRNEEDRRLYLAHMQEKQRQLDTQDFIRNLLLCIEYERLLYEMHTDAQSGQHFERYARLVDQRENAGQQIPLDTPAHVEDVEQKIISLEALLKQVNQQERKKAA